MSDIEKFEAWKKQTQKQLDEIKKRIDMLYKRLSISFDEVILAILWQTHVSYKQLKEIYENGVAMFEVEKAYEK